MYYLRSLRLGKIKISIHNLMIIPFHFLIGETEFTYPTPEQLLGKLCIKFTETVSPGNVRIIYLLDRRMRLVEVLLFFFKDGRWRSDL